jgi:hypothetical protein
MFPDVLGNPLLAALFGQSMPPQQMPVAQSQGVRQQMRAQPSGPIFDASGYFGGGVMQPRSQPQITRSVARPPQTGGPFPVAPPQPGGGFGPTNKRPPTLPNGYGNGGGLPVFRPQAGPGVAAGDSMRAVGGAQRGLAAQGPSTPMQASPFNKMPRFGMF